MRVSELEVGLSVSNRSVYQRTVVTDPDIRKATRDEFTVMLREILLDTIALISFSSHHMTVAKGDATSVPPIARLEFLWTRMEELERVVAQIVRRPVRRLEPEIREVPISRVRHLRAAELRRSFRRGRVGVLQDPSRLPSRLRGCLPLTVSKTVKAHGVDTREHREIKRALRVWSAWLQLVGDRLATTKDWDRELTSQAGKWSRRCRILAHRLNALLALSFFEQVGDNAGPLRVTPVFRRLPQYRRFLSIHRDFNLGMANVLGDFLQVPLSRTFDLYELWAFLRLARAAKVLYPEAPFEVDDLFTASAGRFVLSSGTVSVRFGSSIELWFKRRYREYWTEQEGRGSYSREMVPDYALQPAGATPERRLVVLDAKYRIEEQLNDALSSIHMYRDALVRAADDDAIERVVVAAYLVCPWLPMVDESTAWKTTPMPGRLFHPQYRGVFRFGAFTLRPGQDLEHVVAVLNAVLEDAGEAA